MKANEAFVLFFAGLALFASLGILLSRRLISSAFSLGLLLLAIAGIYASLSLQAALFGQLVLYIGGVMVLIGFALQLYPEPAVLPSWNKVRESVGKGFILLIIMLLCLYFAPWKSILVWEMKQEAVRPNPEILSLQAAGRHLMLDFPLEFEWLGILMLAGLVTAGWYLKEHFSREQK